MPSETEARKKFGPYEILGRIGAGGMGEVFKAHDPRLSRDVAIKVLPASFATDAERLRRFEQEARAVGALNHPNILAVFDLGNHEGQPYIVSELMEGDTLRERIDAGTLPIRKAIDYAQQMAQGLAAAHHKGVVHRDMKPENIFVTRDGRVKILDFGLAKLTIAQSHYATAAPTMGAFRAEGTTPGQVMGTVGYMSPEQVRGADTDHRSDIFSMGTIMYEMFSGQRAFKHDSAVETMSAILKEDPPELEAEGKQIPPGLDRIVRHCMEKNPDERFQSARDIAFDLASLSTTSTTTAQKALSAKRTRAWMAPAAAFAVLLVAGFTGFWLGRSRTAELPRYRQLTFRRGTIQAARLSPDGQTVIYNAAWEGKPMQLFSARTDSPGDHTLGVEGEVLSISKNGEMLLLLRGRNVSAYLRRGVLARMPISGGAPREILEDVQDASWGPDGEQIAAVRVVGSGNTVQLEYPIGTVRYSTGGWISHPRVSSDGKRIAFIDHPLASGDDQGQAAMVDLGGHVSKFPPMFTSAQGVVWSPDGKEIWFSGADLGSDRAVFAVDLSGKMRALLRVPGDFLLQDLLPDGRLLGIRMEGRREVSGKGPNDKEEHDLSWMDWGIPRDITPDGKLFLFEEEGNGGGKDYSVFLRATDGSPAVKLTNFGVAQAISTDGKLAIITSNTTPQQLYLVPTGAGNPVRLVQDDRDYFSVRFLPDNKTIVYCANVPAHPIRCFRMNLDSRKETAIAPENAGLQRPMSADGKTGIMRFNNHVYLWPLDGSWADKSPLDVSPIPGGLGDNYIPVQFAPEQGYLIVAKRGATEILPRKMYRYNLKTGEATFWKSFGPPDLTGVPAVSPPLLSADFSAYVYNHARILGQLYTVEGLK